MIQGIITAVSVGLGCGTCCGSGISAVLFGYMTTHAKNMRQSVAAFLSFYLGKILAVAAICVASSALGKAILDDGGMIGPVDIRLIADGCMVAIGIWMLVKWILERKGSACSHCKGCGHSDGWREAGAHSDEQSGTGTHCGEQSGTGTYCGEQSGNITHSDEQSGTGTHCGEQSGNDAHKSFGSRLLNKIQLAVRTDTETESSNRKNEVNHVALMGMGAGYGASPCAPLIMMAGYAATILPGQAFLSGCIFAVASAIAPMIFLLILSGVLSPKLHREIPQYMDLFRLLSYLLLIIIFLVDML